MPTGSSRRVSFTVNDGLFNSTPAYACVQLIEQNDQPVLTLGPNGTVDVMLTYTEGQSEPLYLARDLNIEGEAGEALAMDSSLVGKTYIIQYRHTRACRYIPKCMQHCAANSYSSYYMGSN